MLGAPQECDIIGMLFNKGFTTNAEIPMRKKLYKIPEIYFTVWQNAYNTILSRKVGAHLVSGQTKWSLCRSEVIISNN